jgi:hypothetical protein
MKPFSRKIIKKYLHYLLNGLSNQTKTYKYSKNGGNGS